MLIKSIQLTRGVTKARLHGKVVVKLAKIPILSDGVIVLSNNNNQVNWNGISLGGILGVVFVVLKLCGVINWSWVWVLSPFWIGLAIAIIASIIIVILVNKR